MKPGINPGRESEISTSRRDFTIGYRMTVTERA